MRKWHFLDAHGASTKTDTQLNSLSTSNVNWYMPGTEMDGEKPFQKKVPLPVKGKGHVAKAFAQRSYSAAALHYLWNETGQNKKQAMASLASDDSLLGDSFAGSSDGSWKAGYRDRSRSQNRTLGGLFGFNRPEINDKTDKLEQLQEVLSGYTTNGLPDYPELVKFQKVSVDDPSVFHIEDHWDGIVEEMILKEMTKRQRDQQEALWELLNTEVQYIKKLQVILDVFKCVLLNLQSEQLLLTEIETDKLFINIHELCSVNVRFWASYLLPVLQDARNSRKGLKPDGLHEGFLKFPEMFYPYTKYCLDQVSSIQYMKHTYKDNDMFKTYVEWCESQKQCNRLKLSDLLVKPMQRLTKYALLLKAVLKKTDCNEDRSDLKQMIKTVEIFVTNVNSTLRKRHDQEQLAAIIKRLECYDVVDGPSSEIDKMISNYANLDLTLPIPGCPGESRSLILEGNLRIRDAVSSRMDVRLFLFTDLLLVCKASNKRGDKFKIVKQPFRVDRIVTYELKDSNGFAMIYLSEYKVATAAYALYCATQTLVRTWIDHIKKAQDLFNAAQKAASEKSDEPTLNFLEVNDEDAELDMPMSAIMSHPGVTDAHARIDSMDSDETKQESTEGDRISPSDTLTSEKAEVSEKWPLLVQTDSFSSNDSDPSGRDLEVLDSIEEECKSKVGQRRVSRGDKRYHTADSIEQLKKEKSNAITKRLSWNSGSAVDVPEEELHPNHPGVKCLSSESMRSSSGVSSNGSINVPYQADVDKRRSMSLSRKSSSGTSDGSVSRRSSGNEHEFIRCDSDGRISRSKIDSSLTPGVQMTRCASDKDGLTLARSASGEEGFVSSPGREHGIRRQSHSLSEFSVDLLSVAEKTAASSNETLPKFKVETIPNEVEEEVSSLNVRTDSKGKKSLTANEKIRMKFLLLNSASIEASDV